MTFRPLSIVAALSMALLTYATLVWLVLVKIRSWICLLYTGFGPGSSPLISRGYISIFGAWVPVWMVICLASIAPTLWIIAAVLGRMRRNDRERMGQCLDCGEWLPARRGRCPRCGLRYERIHLRGEPLFPVIMRPGKRHVRRCT
jgi:hypothetical protein